MPTLFAVMAPLRRRGTPAGVAFTNAASTNVASTWVRPLLDRRLSQAEKAAALAPELIDAILRVEPIYDPTRLEGPNTAPTMAISAGTAAMDNVFADRWRLADRDANVAQTATTLATVWQAKGVLPCEAFTKRRLVGPDEVVQTVLTGNECAALLATEARGFAQDAPVPVTMAPSARVAVFAAPLPGSRMSSADFWTAQKARIAAIQNKLPGAWPTGREAPAPVRDAHRTLRSRVARLGTKPGAVAAANDP